MMFVTREPDQNSVQPKRRHAIADGFLSFRRSLPYRQPDLLQELPHFPRKTVNVIIDILRSLPARCHSGIVHSILKVHLSSNILASLGARPSDTAGPEGVNGESPSIGRSKRAALLEFLWSGRPICGILRFGEGTPSKRP